jgi:hypothetical protein
VAYQLLSHWIVQDVIDLLVKLFGRAQHVIKGFLLPDLALASQAQVDQVGRSSLDGFRDFCQCIDLHFRFVDQRGEDHVRVVGHDHHSVEINLPLIFVEAGIEHHGARPIGEQPPLVSAEGEEVRLEVTLKMRKIAAASAADCTSALCRLERKAGLSKKALPVWEIDLTRTDVCGRELPGFARLGRRGRLPLREECIPKLATPLPNSGPL